MLRILLVSEHASSSFGGEAALPLHYFRVLRRRGFAVWLVVHERTRGELEQLYPNDPNIHYVQDTWFHRMTYQLGRIMPARVEYFTTGYARRLSSQWAQKRLARRLVQERQIDVVHQPMPVSPREPSLMFGLGVPVIIGPMNGGIGYPPAFQRHQSRVVDALLAVGRLASHGLNRLIPGKLESATLLVANERTRRALPPGTRGRVVELAENGVDLGMWGDACTVAQESSAALTRFVFLGRLVDWKAVDLLLPAFRAAAAHAPMSLTIVGDGPERARLEETCRSWGTLADDQALAGQVQFTGWRSQQECADILKQSSALVLPSLMECGGAVVLEAMAASRPVIATDWGGPSDYLDPSCGILVPPSDRGRFEAGLTEAMVRLAQSPTLRERMGRAGYRKVAERFDWEVKVDRILEIYRDAVHAGAPGRSLQSAVEPG